MARRSMKTRPVTFHPPFRNAGYFVLDSLGMVLCQFMPIEFIRVNGETHEAAKWIVDALNSHAEAERRAIAAGGIVEAVRDSPGNAAAMRDALNEIDRVVWDKRRHTKEETEAHRLATEALSKPARNCDVYKTSWDVVTHWDGGLDSTQSVVRMLDWLLAPAAERKGEGDGDK